MTKPAKAKPPKRDKKNKQSRTVKRAPAHRLALVITPALITLLERSGQNIRQESLPITTPLFAITGLADAAGFVNAVRMLKQKLGSKAKHVDVHYPGMLSEVNMLSVPNVDIERPEEIEMGAGLRVTTDLHLKPENTNHVLFPVHQQPAAAVISSDRKHLKAIVESVTAAGLTLTALTPTPITALHGTAIGPEMTAVIHLEANANTLFLLNEGRIIYAERLSDLGRVIARTGNTLAQEDAFIKLETTTDWNPQALVSEILRGVLQQANDHLNSIGLPVVEQTLISGNLAHQSHFMTALAEGTRVEAATGKVADFADDVLLSGAVTPYTTDGWDLTSTNLLSADLKPVSQRSAPNIGIILPIALTAGWVAYAVVINLQANTLKRDEAFKKDNLAELQRFAGEQQKLQAENQQISQTLQLKTTITAKDVKWHEIIAKFTQSLPTENGKFLATLSSFSVSQAKPDQTRYGDLPVAYAYEVTANAKTRMNALDFIRHYSTSPYAIDVQRLEKKPDGTWAINATIGAKK